MQQVNLYPASAREVIPLLPARTLISGGLALCAALGLLYAVALYRMAAARLELRALESEQEVLKAKHEELEQLAARLREDPSLDKKIAGLRQDLDDKARMLNALLIEAGSNTVGFSPLLVALARQRVDGVWFQEVRVERGGKELTLSGRTLSASLLPRVIEQLGREPAFAGREFRGMKLSTVDAARGGGLSFELSTHGDPQKGAGEDKGGLQGAAKRLEGKP